MASGCAAKGDVTFCHHPYVPDMWYRTYVVLSASRLRADIYRVLDEVLRTGQPAEVERNGRRLRIIAVGPPSLGDVLVSHPDAVVGDPSDLVHIDWTEAWRP